MTGTFGDFASYQWFGPTTSVGSSWSVPRIESAGSDENAASWVGAQSDDGAFIQIGTIETHTGSGGATTPLDSAFWSDTAFGFRPQILGPVHPGDRVDAALSLSSGTWHLQLQDPGSSLAVEFSTQDGAQANYTVAEWAEERQPPTSDWRFPALSPVGFSAVRVDGQAPARSQLDATWMSVPGIDLGPTPLRGDAFEIAPMHPGTTTTAYLSGAAKADEAIEGFVKAHARWNEATTDSQVAAEIRPVLVGLRAFDEVLVGTSWPAPIRAEVRRLQATNAHAVSEPLIALERAPLGARPLAYARFTLATVASHQLALGIRRYLGLPEQ